MSARLCAGLNLINRAMTRLPHKHICGPGTFSNADANNLFNISALAGVAKRDHGDNLRVMTTLKRGSVVAITSPTPSDLIFYVNAIHDGDIIHDHSSCFVGTVMKNVGKLYRSNGSIGPAYLPGVIVMSSYSNNSNNSNNTPRLLTVSLEWENRYMNSMIRFTRNLLTSGRITGVDVYDFCRQEIRHLDVAGSCTHVVDMDHNTKPNTTHNTKPDALIL